MWFRNEMKEQVREQLKSRIPKSNTKYDQVVMLTRIDQFNFEVPPCGQIVHTFFDTHAVYARIHQRRMPGGSQSYKKTAEDAPLKLEMWWPCIDMESMGCAQKWEKLLLNRSAGV